MRKVQINKEYSLYLSEDFYHKNPELVKKATDIIERGTPFDILGFTYTDTRGRIFYCGGGITRNDIIPYPEAQGEGDLGQYPGARQVDFTPLWAFLISNKAEKIMGKIPEFGKEIFAHADYCLEARFRGLKLGVTTEIKLQYRRIKEIVNNRKEWIKEITEAKKRFEDKWGDVMKDQYVLPVVFHTHTGFPGGYCLHARELIKALCQKKVKVHYKFVGGSNNDEPDTEDYLVDDLKTDMGSMRMTQVVLSTGLCCFSNSGDYKVGFTTTEVDSLPANWVNVLNEMDEVWTTSEFAKKSFEFAGVKVPIYNLREGVNPNYFHPGITPMTKAVREKFVFISNFAWGKRKGPDVLFEAFKKEFSDDEDVCLVIKTLPSYINEDIKASIKSLYDRKHAAPIYVWDTTLPMYQLGSFYTAGNVFVFPTRGEGFGIPPLEALACGIPVITTGYSAQTEYLLENGKQRPGVEFIKYKKVKYDGGDSCYYTDTTWCDPDMEHLRKLMRKMYTEYADYKAAAMISSEKVRKEWNWDICADLVIERLKAIELIRKTRKKEAK